MTQPDPPARLPPVAPEDYTEETRTFLNRWTGGIFKNSEGNPVLRTFAHHPHLADVFSQFNIHLLSTNTLPVQQRQIAILRTAWLTRAVYMWSSHLNTSLRCGLSDAMFEPVKNGPDDPWFSPFERQVMLATDEVVHNHVLSEATWNALAQEWNSQQMLDFLFTVGCYVTTAAVMRSTGVERQEDLLELAEKYGAPAAD